MRQFACQFPHVARAHRHNDVVRLGAAAQIRDHVGRYGVILHGGVALFLHLIADKGGVNVSNRVFASRRNIKQQHLVGIHQAAGQSGPRLLGTQITVRLKDNPHEAPCLLGSADCGGDFGGVVGVVINDVRSVEGADMLPAPPWTFKGGQGLYCAYQVAAVQVGGR